MSSYAAPGVQSAEPVVEEESPPPRATSALSNYRTNSTRMSLGSSAGRPLAQEPRTVPIRKNVSPTRVFSRPVPVSPNTAFKENGQRQKEKEEARSLRDALEEMDIQDDARIHGAAQDEATELVWMHQNPGVPFKNPYSPYRNPDENKSPQDAEKSPRAPGQTRGFRKSFMSSPRRNSRHSASDNPSDGQKGVGTEDNGGRLAFNRRSHLESNENDSSPRKSGMFRKNLKVNFSLPAGETSPEPAIGSNGNNQRTVSNESSKGVFRNPNDQIYEEPEEKAADDRPDFSKSDSSALRAKPRNALPRGSRPLPGRLSSLPFVDKLSRFDIHKNPPTQSRNAEYTTNDPFVSSDTKTTEEEAAPLKDGLEIRSDDIRAATSKRRTDRSSNLPMPSAVSDRTGRPIVSFDPTWKPTEAESPSRNRGSLKGHESASPTPPREPAAPTIQVSEAPSIPVINLPDDKEPTISEIEAGSVQAPENDKRPLPDPTRSSNHHPNQSPKRPAAVSQNRWYTPYTRAGVPTAKCESCTLPISGKIVTAAESRFHPECFVCYHCHTALECVGFFQEPEAKRNERLAETPNDDQESRVIRFYCHLDFHELFSPRCKSCKTPIEGEVVVACGSEWHVGHFFCAECGDVSSVNIFRCQHLTNLLSQPFDSSTPFVEKDGFAWCLQCYSRRTAPKCLGCKKPVQEDVVITAIGGQWHNECFNCHECGHGFGAHGRFFVREGEPRRTAKGRIIGGPVQLAICEGCEAIRLKSAHRI